MDGQPPFRSTQYRSDTLPPAPSPLDLHRHQHQHQHQPFSRTASSSSTFPGRLYLPDPPAGLSGPVPIGGRTLSLLGRRSVTPSSSSSTTHQPRVVSGNQSLSSLLNHNLDRGDHHYHDHRGQDDRVYHRSDQVPSPRSRAGYQENRLTGLPSPDNSPPLNPHHHPQPGQSDHQRRLEHVDVDVKPFSHTNRLEDGRYPVRSPTERARSGRSEDYYSRPRSDVDEVVVKEEQGEQGDESIKRQKKRTRLNTDQGVLLKKVWRETCFPSTERRSWLAEQTGLSVRQVQVWFQNQRQKQRNEEYEASKSFSADAPHPLSGPRVAFDTPIAPRDLPEKIYHAQGWSSIGPEPGVKRRGSGDRPGTSSSGRPMTGEDRGQTSEGSRTGTGSGPAPGPLAGDVTDVSRGWRQGGPVDTPSSSSFHGPSSAPPPMQRMIWDQHPLPPPPPPRSAPHSADPSHVVSHKRTREDELVDPLGRPVKMYRSAAHLSESPPGKKDAQTPVLDRFPRLPSIRELGLNADRQAGIAMGMNGGGVGHAIQDRGLPSIPGMMGLLSGPGRL